MEMTDQCMNLHRISLRRKVPGEEHILETLQLRKSVFPYNLSGSLDARVRMPSSETLSPMKVRTARWTRATESIRLQKVWTAQHTLATKSLQGGLDADTRTAYRGSTLWNRSDARVASPDALQ
jgi:hypothetical protein